MAISTMKTYLFGKHGAETEFTKLADIKDFPDLGGAPEMLETTTLSDVTQTFINGIQNMDAMEFTVNYTEEDYDALVAKAGDQMSYELQFGTAGEYGTFQWDGEHSVWVVGGGVNAVVDMKMSIAPSTAVTKKA